MEEVANLYEWNATERLRVARCKLTGIAREFAYRSLKIKHVTDYDKFKEILITRFDTEPLSVKTQKFHQCIQGKNEDVQAYAVRLQSLAAGTCSVPVTTSNAEKEIVENYLQGELDTKLKTQFLSGLNPTIRRQVLSRDPTTFEEAVTIATREEMVEQLTARPKYYINAADVEVSALQDDLQQLRLDLEKSREQEQKHRERRDQFFQSQLDEIYRINNMLLAPISNLSNRPFQSPSPHYVNQVGQSGHPPARLNPIMGCPELTNPKIPINTRSNDTSPNRMGGRRDFRRQRLSRIQTLV